MAEGANNAEHSDTNEYINTDMAIDANCAQGSDGIAWYLLEWTQGLSMMIPDVLPFRPW
jgi:hypothetical protein